MKCIRCEGEIVEFSTNRKIKSILCLDCELEVHYAPKAISKEANRIQAISDKVTFIRV